MKKIKESRQHVFALFCVGVACGAFLSQLRQEHRSIDPSIQPARKFDQLLSHSPSISPSSTVSFTPSSTPSSEPSNSLSPSNTASSSWGSGLISPPDLEKEEFVAGAGPFCPVARDEPPRGKIAFVLVPADSAYWLAALVAAHSLQKVETVADIVLAYLPHPTITSNLLDRARAMGLILRPVKGELPRIASTQSYDTSVMKISEPWGSMGDYDRVILFDMDNVALRNIDHLFFCPEATSVNHIGQIGRRSDPSCNSCSSACMPERKWMTSSMMVLRPNPHMVASIVSCQHPDITFLGDMDFINCAFKCQFHSLPIVYQILDSPTPYFPKLSNRTFVVHWSCGRKPFWADSATRLLRRELVPDTDGCSMSSIWHKLFWELQLDVLIADLSFVWPPLKV